MTGGPRLVCSGEELVGLPLPQAEQRLNESGVAFSVEVADEPHQDGRKGGAYVFGEELRVVRAVLGARGWRLLAARVAERRERV